MNNNKYLIFDIVCDYLKDKGLQTCLSFRLVSNECKIISTKLFDSHFSAYIMNKKLIDAGYDHWFIEICLPNMTKNEHLDYIKWLIIELLYNNTYKDYNLIRYEIDPLNPIKNALKNKMKIRRRLFKRTSQIFSLALDWAERPRYRLRYIEMDNM